MLTTKKLRRAVVFFDGLTEELDLVQRRLDQKILSLARKAGYGEAGLGSSQDLAELSPKALLMLKEELQRTL